MMDRQTLIQLRAERTERLNQLDDLFRPAVEEALAEDNPAPILYEAAQAVFTGEYLANGGPAPAPWPQFLQDIEPGIDATVPKPEEDDQVDLVTGWLATATMSAATMYADPASTKTWITMQDDDVREVHRELLFTTIGVNEDFSVRTQPQANLKFPGQPVGPLEAWINCRCFIDVDVVMTASAFASDNTPPQGVRDEAQKGLDWRSEYGRGGTGIGIARGRDLSNGVNVSDNTVKRMKAYFDRHQSDKEAEGWSPGEDGYPSNGRIAWALWGGDPGWSWSRKKTNLMEAAMDDIIIEDEEIEEEIVEADDELPPVPDELIDAEDNNQIFSGVLMVEGSPTGDGRMFEDGSVTWRDLPLPLRYVRSDVGAHDGAVTVGRINRIERDGEMILGEGELFSGTPEFDEVVMMLANGLGGVSVDIDMASGDMAEDQTTSFSRGRISAATLVDIPAFAEAVLVLGALDPEDDMLEVPDGMHMMPDGTIMPDSEMPSDEYSEMTIEMETFKRGSGWVTNPEETRRLHRYWTRGEGAAKIRWSTSGDFTRCTQQLRKYISPQFLNRTCAQWHHDALGYWPGECGKPGNPPCGASRNAGGTMNLTAAAPPLAVTHDMFANPKLKGPTPLTFVGDRVFGHLATFGVCHIGIDKVCVEAPKSSSKYAYFHTGAIDTDKGTLSIGKLTMNTGHADRELNAHSTVSHYDHTGSAVAWVRAGEDQFGIWFSGVFDGTDEQRRLLQASGGLSGDWRSIGGKLELVAALAVNVPGFPIPRTGFSVDDGKQLALVAAGLVVDEKPQVDVSALASAVADELESRVSRGRRLSSLREPLAEIRKERVEALKARLD